MPARSNQDLAPIPSDEEILRALAYLERQALDHSRDAIYGVTTAHLAGFLGVESARRGGRGAVKGSWSGWMSPALRLSPRMRSLAKRGLVRQGWDPEERTRYRYHLTIEGRTGLDAW